MQQLAHDLHRESSNWPLADGHGGQDNCHNHPRPYKLGIPCSHRNVDYLSYFLLTLPPRFRLPVPMPCPVPVSQPTREKIRRSSACLAIPPLGKFLALTSRTFISPLSHWTHERRTLFLSFAGESPVASTSTSSQPAVRLPSPPSQTS